MEQLAISRKTVEIPCCGGPCVAVSFPHPPQPARDQGFSLCPAFLKGPGVDRWVGCGWAHGMGTGRIPLAVPTAPTWPCVASAREADLLVQREPCRCGVFYDCYLDESQLHCEVMLIIVSTKLDLFPLPLSLTDLKLSLTMQSYSPLGDFSTHFWEGEAHALNGENIALISLYSASLAFNV